MALKAALTRLSDDIVSELRWSLYQPAAGQAVIEPKVGWLVCNGALVSRTTYATLYAQIGFAFSPTPGTDPGSNNFYLPDARDGVNPLPMGATNFPTRGARGGEYTHALTAAQIASHIHTAMYDSFHPLYINDGNWNNNYFGGPGPGGALSRNTNGEPNNGPYGQAHENMPPVQTVGCLLIRYV